MKSIMKKAIAGIALTALMFATAMASSDSTYLFVLRSKNAEISKVNGKYKLAMTTPHIIYFSDRPLRQVGKMSSRKFLTMWNSKSADSFRVNPPNAYISGVTGSTTAKHLHYVDNVITLTYPKRTVANKAETIVFNVQPVGKKPLVVGKSSEMQMVVDGCTLGGGSCSGGG